MTHVMAATPPTLSSMLQNQSQVSPMEQAVSHLRRCSSRWRRMNLIDDGHDGHHKQIMRNTLISRCRSNRFKSSGPVRFISLFCFIAATFPQAARQRQASYSLPSPLRPREARQHPSCMTATRSDTPMTSGSSLDTTITPTPLSPVDAARGSLLAPTSMPRVGSSMMMTFGARESHFPIRHFC